MKKDLPNGFKMTELGPLPEEWEVVRLGEVSPPFKSTLNPIQHSEEIFDYYSIPAYQDVGKALPEYGKNIKSQKLVVEEDDVLFGKLNPRVPKVWLVETSNRRKIASTEFIPLRPKDQSADSLFLFFLCWSQHIMPKARELVSGSTPSRQRVDTRAFFKLQIPLPPLPEQRAIAHVLRTVQRAKEATEKVIQAARELKKSLMRHLFTYGPVPLDQAEQVRLKETEIGPVPEDWELVKLGDLCRIVRGGSPRPKGDPRYFSKRATGIHWIKISDLTKYKRGLYITATDEYLTEEGKKKSRFLKRGTFVVTNSGTVGIPAFLGTDGCIHDGYLAFLDLEASKLHEFYLYYWIENIKTYLEKIAPRGTQANLNTTIAKNLFIPLPPIPEQRKIVRTLQAVDRKIEAEEQRKAALGALFKTLLHHLMTGEVRVKELSYDEGVKHGG